MTRVVIWLAKMPSQGTVKLREVLFTALLDSYTERRPGTNLYIFNLNSFAVTLSF